MKQRTREQWLNKVAELLKKTVFKRAGYDLGLIRYRIGCGLPNGVRAFGNRRTIGQCWTHSVSADKTHEIFISPTVDDSLQVAHTLAHELCHAVVGVDHGHDKVFRKCAKAIGLAGKMTATEPTEVFAKFLKAKLKKLGAYPHQKMDVTKRKKQTTRMIKLECPCCGYTVRASGTWILIGLPKCPDGTEFEVKN